MRVVDLIEKKRDGGELTPAELRALVQGFVSGAIPDYQMAAFLMAVYFRGMNEEETVALTQAMVESGERLDLSGVPGVKVDKHSTGGVGDSVTLVLVPLMAAAGLVMAKLSGRALGHTGGTIDKFESIPGVRTELTPAEIVAQAHRVGAVIADHTAELVPADRLIYELRDVTGTVPSLPLIAASVLSKKIAGGADVIVLDVKCGDGAFMRTLAEARELAWTLVRVGNRLGKKFAALITAMEEPLGRMAGNALEVRQALEVLRGEGPVDLREVTLALGAELLVLAGEANGPAEGREKLARLLASGAALRKFQELVAAQGGDPRVAEDPRQLPRAAHVVEVPAEKAGYVQRVAARRVGLAAGLLGAGREVKGQRVDPVAGVELLVKVGAEVEKGQPLARLHVGRSARLPQAMEQVRLAFTFGPEKPAPSLLILDRIV
mgnify:CR=1 FL=1